LWNLHKRPPISAISASEVNLTSLFAYPPVGDIRVELRRGPTTIALTRYLDDGNLPCDNNWVENQIRPIAIGRSNWLFAGSLRAGKRAAAIMSLVHSAKMNGHDPYAYLRDILERLLTQPANLIDELLPHRWASLTEVVRSPPVRVAANGIVD